MYHLHLQIEELRRKSRDDLLSGIGGGGGNGGGNGGSSDNSNNMDTNGGGGGGDSGDQDEGTDETALTITSSTYKVEWKAFDCKIALSSTG